MKLKKYLKAILIFLLPIFLLNFLVFALAWTGPTESPPGGNVPTFLNSSDQGQFKIGALGVGGLFEAKTIRINPTDAVMVDCQESFRGLLWFNRNEIEGDDISICRKDEGVATYSWQELGGGGIELLEQSAPGAPSLAANFVDGITLNPLTTCPGDSPQYKIEGGDWQESTEFTGLIAETFYNFSQRCGGYTEGCNILGECDYYGFSEGSLSSSFETETIEDCSSRNIGEACQGGVVAYHDGSGGGLIAATSDQSTGVQWGCRGTLIGGTSTDYGEGAANTDAIIAFHEGWSSPWETGPDGETCNSANDGTVAARIARDYDGGGYNDWFLPSRDELNQLYLNRAAIGGFNTTEVRYRSSSETNHSAYSVVQRFEDGTQSNNLKNNAHYVRAVRAF